MTLVSTTQLVRTVNEKAIDGKGVPVFAFRCCGEAGARHEAISRYVMTRLRMAEILAYQPRNKTYALACFGSIRDGERDWDAAFEAHAASFGNLFRDVAGMPFARAWRRIVRPTTVAALFRSLDIELTAHVERRRALARIAHELRSPLCSIRGYLELLEGRGSRSSERFYVQTARAETLRLGRMLDGMLEFSLLEGSAGCDVLSCDVSAAVERAVAATHPRAMRSGVDVRIATRTRRAARVAPDDCVRATTNVLDNAINAGARSVILASICREGVIGVTVDDDGPGVRSSERKAIFACGQRGEAAKNYSGNGFGLAAVHAIVRSCGGSVSAARSPLGGARFSLRFRSAERSDKRPR
jgi:signal transduction histidine kinase